MCRSRPVTKVASHPAPKPPGRLDFALQVLLFLTIQERGKDTRQSVVIPYCEVEACWFREW